MKFIFSSLFSNDTVINESKKQPWWLALIIVIISCVVAIIPSITNILGYNGSDVITQVDNKNLDYSLKTFTYEYLRKDGDNAPKIEMYIDEDGKLNCNYTQTVEIKYEDKITLLFAYVATEDLLNAKINELKTSYPVAVKEGDPLKSQVHSMLLFTSANMYLYLYDKDASCTYIETNKEITACSDPNSSMTGQFKNVNDTARNFNNYFDTTLSNSEAYDRTLSKWTELFNDSYKVVKESAALSSAGIYFLMDLGVILIMSLTLFFLSRTKSSIRKIGFLEGIKMVLFASLSPGLLALLLGFLIPSMQTMSFILFLGLRITWLGMKATSPDESSSQPVRK